jgi:hypothetical protein
MMINVAVDKTALEFSETSGQGDQIGRIFAFWAIIFFGQLFGHY